MKRLVSASLALLPFFLASCQLPAPAGMAPAPTTTEGQSAARPPADNVLASETAAAIARGEVGNAISGTIELPINLRKLARFTNGAPPVTLHAFRVTGPVIRNAKVSLFWKDDHAIGYVVDDVPSDYPIVLAATIEPGVVVRTLVPAASRQNPARGQIIDQRSETIVMKAYLAGLLPPVGLGGTAEVLRQGGLDPATAANANQEAANLLDRLAKTDWAKEVVEVAETATTLKNLSLAQSGVANTLGSQAPGAWGDAALTVEVFKSTRQVRTELVALSAKIATQVEQGSIPTEVADLLTSVSTQLERAAITDLPRATAVVPTTGTYNLSSVPGAASSFLGSVLDQRLLYSPPPSPMTLASIYEEMQFQMAANGGFTNADGRSFTEAEIAQSLASGKGPYRTDCAQITFSGETNCKVVVNPQDKSREVLVTREAALFAKKLASLEAAIADYNPDKVEAALKAHPALTNFIVDDQARWNSPVGTWRMRLLQDEGPEVLGEAGFPVIGDAEMTISPPEGQAASPMGELGSGTFLGVLSVWMPDFDLSSPGENLDNFALRFEWDAEHWWMTDGVLTGERRLQKNGNERYDYSAIFNADMVESNRVLGYWFNDKEGLAGRFELIRGTADFTI